MFEIFADDDFAAAHNLRNYNGKCENLHGHNYKVRVFVRGERLGQSGMLVDFTLLKQKMGEVLAVLDHKYLNDIPPFDKENPTAENIARYVYEKIKSAVPADQGAFVHRVSVWETDKNCATYFE
jgi:6-pyruvoyltetrahydropterin/6-carboxytetrahydropterin synthase